MKYQIVNVNQDYMYPDIVGKYATLEEAEVKLAEIKSSPSAGPNYFVEEIKEPLSKEERINAYWGNIKHQERDMKISTMIVLAVAFWAYVAFCLWAMGKFAGAI